MGYKSYNYKYSDYKLKSRFFVCIVFISDKKNDSNYDHASNNVIRPKILLYSMKRTQRRDKLWS